MKLGKTEYRKISYMEWLRLHVGKVQYDLARSNVKPVTVQELGLELRDVDLSRNDEGGCEELASMVAERYGVETKHVMTTNGATMGIFLVYATLLRKGDEVILEAPNYEPLYRMAIHLGAEVKMVERPFERDFDVDLEEIQRKISKSTRAIVVTNLHNPSGVAINPDKLLTIGQIARSYNAFVIVSEVYLDNALSGHHKPAATYLPNMISINSLSKVYGLPGIRVGWVVGPEEVIARMRTVADYVAGGISYPSEKIALVALKQAPMLLERSKSIVRRNFERVRTWVDKNPALKMVQPEGGTFVMVKIPSHIPAQDLMTLLREKYSTLIVPGDFFWMKGIIRISCGMDEAILEKGLANITTALGEWKDLWR